MFRIGGNHDLEVLECYFIEIASTFMLLPPVRCMAYLFLVHDTVHSITACGALPALNGSIRAVSRQLICPEIFRRPRQ